MPRVAKVRVTLDFFTGEAEVAGRPILGVVHLERKSTLLINLKLKRQNSSM